MQLAIGILLVFGCVFGGFVLHGGALSSIWQPTEILIISGAAAGALVMGNPRSVLSEMGSQIKHVIARKSNGVEFQRELLLMLYELLETVRDGGLKALDQHVEEPKESDLFRKYPMILAQPRLIAFIVDNFRLMAMGRITQHELEGMLDQELEAIESELMQPSRSLSKIAESMPGFGILAAVLGIVTTMANIGGSVSEIGLQVAAAMVGTFIGILLCYGVLEPLASAMVHRVKSDMSALECVKVVLCAQVAGKPTLLAVDAGRKLIQLDVKPSFSKLESWIMEI
ncbi:flagellar motor stator protein MotA [Burkholderia thailandensis]|uniref:Chemotaxis MotA protein n=1 Tax=Burkholderia thailandensis (strain ATCC 700388 / DSM 13276 / CCUG 48851 / CIP 106301 / E264) TaxID=271848 RepID=Q2T8Z4_BURTA|nr:flagellar motor stator protein MotA [Burkholderia thailandensis]ABC35881.1 chemotaxis MotA protein [Burkholderia thailandensis E264]AHI75788.1 flagellar motor stator protein MotA [Burkholderia thailandensis 2002721723]AHI81959.1 flagellar motor stator protein MotA [Burkholderia thailandensis E444]AIC89152.1 flagellar motor stator protein MotA [Burkholderia thailandensis USAMRU Malaysia \